MLSFHCLLCGMCLYMGQDSSCPCTVTCKIYCAFPSNLSLYQSYTLNEAQDFSNGGVMLFTLFHKIKAQLTKSYIGYCLTATQDVCVCVCVCGGGGGGRAGSFPFSCQQNPKNLAPIPVVRNYVRPVGWGTGDSPRPVLRWSGGCWKL
jgi:hypothetical protein